MKTLELDITFSRDYFTHRFGIRFGNEYYDDVRTRAETDQLVKQALYQRFGDYGLGETEPSPLVQIGYDDTLNIALLFGGAVDIREGISWISTGYLHREAVFSLKVPDISSTWPHTKFIRQYKEIVDFFGPGTAMPPRVHGILESALEMRGQEFLEDIILYPNLACHLLDVLTDTVIAIKEFWDKKCYGKIRPGVELGSCSTTILSRQQVREFLVPRYRKIASRFDRAFLCSCGVSTHNLENFALVENAYFVRCGWGTDYNKAARILYGRHLKASLDANRVATQSPVELDKDVQSVLSAIEQIESASLLLIHASAETPDANIVHLISCVRNWTKSRGVKLILKHA